jgi:hypothetical protein
VDPRADLDAVKKRKYLASAGNRTPAVQPVAIPTELSGLHISTVTNTNLNVAVKVAENYLIVVKLGLVFAPQGN